MSYQLELRHLRYFLAVAEELHFRRAADRLFISQPGLSRQIKQLEDQLGYPLFVRTNRTVSLTPAGIYLQTEAANILQKLDGALHHARALHEGQEGRLNFGYVGSAMQNIIPELLLRFRKDYPKVIYGLDAMGNQEQIDRLLTRDIDLGFVRLDAVPRELASKPLFVDTFSIVLPEDHPVSAENYTGIHQLAEEPFILFDPGYSQPYYDKVMEIFTDGGLKPNVSHRTVHATTIYRLVENKFGLSIVPTSLRMGYRMDVKFIELTDIPQRTTLSVIWRKDNENPALKNFVELL
ncbi:LysR family transcriptional regulator [Neolewinella aurantiaca]|uniref:LysR family transcriptional regulator n=1 Tax=Neolewinella aurantiaca TaxID=2602767 RepID=A0A5C7FIY3_9BACT|nr:LysR family transcriptional regulator [Neolewinella aurantiaca]TXF90568.1 LysR family transcriptional regulator [Neolewinella aurantiaca]